MNRINWKGFLLNTVAIAPLAIGCSLNAASQSDPAVYMQAGDITARSAVLWARCNQERVGRLVFDLSTEGNFDAHRENNARSKVGPHVGAKTDYTGSVILRGLESSQTYYYRARCVGGPGQPPKHEAVGPVGTFKTAADKHEEEGVKFAWVADLAGQGWGRNPDLSIVDVEGNEIQGGYVIFDVIHRLEPDFALLAGDNIYADNAIPAIQEIPPELGGGAWINDPTKDFVALALEDYRANWKYNLGDEKLRNFLLSTPVYVQWDDHEVSNNWYPGEILTAAPYHGIEADALAARSRQALFEYNPIKGKRIYRQFQRGKHLALFLLDERSFRGPNTDNFNPAGTEMLGQRQLKWLKKALKHSKATWKVISTHDPLSIVTGGPDDRDAWSQGDADILGREVQLAELLRFIKAEDIRNVVFITADVHFAAAIHYTPERATGRDVDFTPFWEFVIGPVHAGAFGIGDLDPSFGPQYEYVRGPSTEGLPQNAPPPNLHSFGLIEVTAAGDLIARIHDITGEVLMEQVLVAQ